MPPHSSSQSKPKFGEDWIEFAGPAERIVPGTTQLLSVLRESIWASPVAMENNSAWPPSGISCGIGEGAMRSEKILGTFSPCLVLDSGTGVIACGLLLVSAARTAASWSSSRGMLVDLASRRASAVERVLTNPIDLSSTVVGTI